jgi:hypothetical protein
MQSVMLKYLVSIEVQFEPWKFKNYSVLVKTLCSFTLLTSRKDEKQTYEITVFVPCVCFLTPESFNFYLASSKTVRRATNMY